MSSTSPDHILSVAARQPDSATYASVVLLMGLGAAGTTLAAVPANAASDGAMAQAGATSSGRIQISLTIPERIEVRGMRDIELARTATGGINGESTGCVFGRGAGQYSVSALGGSTQDFDLVFASGDAAPRALTMGEALQNLAGAGGDGCAEGTSNARLALRMKPATPLGALPLALPPSQPLPNRGALTLLIAPE